MMNHFLTDTFLKLQADSYQLTAFCREDNILFISTRMEMSLSNSSSVIKNKSRDSISWYSSSTAEANAIFKNFRNCGSEFLPQPSAIFVGTEAEDRLICETNPYISSLGNLPVILYTIKTNLWDFSQTLRSLKSFIFNHFLLKNSCQLNAER